MKYLSVFLITCLTTTSLYLFAESAPQLLTENSPKTPLALKPGDSTYPTIFTCPCPQLIAHRGASGNYPESTLLAFEKAIEFNTNILELDVHLSKDGEIIVAHDKSLARTTGEDLFIKDLILSDIKATDAGFMFQNESGNHPYRGKGLSVLTLIELYNAFPNERFNIELKAGSVELAEKVWAFVKDNHLESKVVVASAHSNALIHYRSIKTSSAISSAHTTEIISAYIHAFFNWSIKNPDYRILQIPHNYLTSNMVKFFHANNLVVQVWTVNDPKDISRMLEIGVDGIMTNYPERAAPIFKARERDRAQ